MAVFENDFQLAKEVVNKVFEWHTKQEFPDVTFDYTNITIENDMNEKQRKCVISFIN